MVFVWKGIRKNTTLLSKIRLYYIIIPVQNLIGTSRYRTDSLNSSSIRSRFSPHGIMQAGMAVPYSC